MCKGYVLGTLLTLALMFPVTQVVYAYTGKVFVMMRFFEPMPMPTIDQPSPFLDEQPEGQKKVAKR